MAFTAGGNHPTNVDYVPRSGVQQRIAPTTPRLPPERADNSSSGDRATLAADGEADRIGQEIGRWTDEYRSTYCFLVSLSFQISAIVVIEAGRQDRPANRPDLRSFYLNRLKNKSLISHGIGQ